MKKLGQDPAFANRGQIYKPTQLGMSKRLYIATAAMQSILEHNGFYWQGDNTLENLSGVLPEHAAQLAFQYADALLKEEIND